MSEDCNTNDCSGIYHILLDLMYLMDPTQKDYEACNTYMFDLENPREGGWGTWSPWSSCGSDCIKSKSRSCNNPTPEIGGADCKGASSYFYTCSGESCKSKIFILRILKFIKRS